MNNILEFNQQFNSIKAIKKEFNEKLKFNMFDLVILQIIYDKKDVNMQYLVKTLGIIQPEVNKSVQLLRSHNFISKERNKNDERTVTVHINRNEEKKIKQLLKDATTIIKNN